ncbi:hypothetical protein QFC20_000319 [Naganishia adeliensis]|uniref:Uncharacterized protein n=1 Tax=Naganishia adeliensis TaxID=92952 RepID=A0ACC2X297_9TREE|nr:hypothetical protein QFC20_000319 [Naganishia adeliensis]
MAIQMEREEGVWHDDHVTSILDDSWACVVYSSTSTVIPSPSSSTLHRAPPPHRHVGTNSSRPHPRPSGSQIISAGELEAFLGECVEEIRGELRGREMDLKAEGVVKMCYLMMLYPLPPPPSFAFHVVEVMSSPRYHLKQLGYLAAPMAFSTDTEEVVLTDLLSPHAHLPPIALAGLADIVTPSLARDVYADVGVLLTHSRAHVRKRAVLAMFKIFEQYPEALRTGFTRLRDRLADDDPGVVSATVNVITELSRKSNPRNYLPLAPQLFELLTTSSNNWMLIKIIKLFGALTPLEPRLVRKLLPPITNLISTTPAISLLYECVRTCIVGGMLDGQTEAGDALARVCVEKLSGFLTDEDQNLKYIALLAMVKIVPSHPHLIAEYQDEILASLDDEDMSIRMRALELTCSMVNRRNIREIVTRLLKDLAPSTATPVPLPTATESLAKSAASDTIAAGTTISDSPAHRLTPAYRTEVVHRILDMTSADTYVNITDFEWYMTVLVDLAYVSNVNVGEEIKERILDVTARVRGNFRPFVVQLMQRLLKDETFVANANEEGSCCEILYAASWVVGEYCHLSANSKKDMIDTLLNPALYQINNEISVVTLTAAVKVFAYFTAEAAEDWKLDLYNDAKDLVAKMMQTLSSCSSSPEVELQERAVNFLQLFRLLEADLSASKPPSAERRSQDAFAAEPEFENAFAEDNANSDKNENGDSAQPNYPKSLFLLRPLFTGYEMNSIGYKAQESVKVPDDLDLEATLVDWTPDETLDFEFPTETADDEEDMGQGGGANLEELRRVLKGSSGKSKKGKGKRVNDDGTEETREERAARKAARKAKQKDNPYYLNDIEDDVDTIPIVKLDLDDKDEVPSDSKKKPRKSKKAREPSPPPPDIDRSGEMPAGSEPVLKAKKTLAEKSAKHKEGLRGVDIGGDVRPSGSDTPQVPTHFVEYRDDDAEDVTAASTPPVESVAVASSDVQVVRVKRKKKKVLDGSSKKKAEA